VNLQPRAVTQYTPQQSGGVAPATYDSTGAQVVVVPAPHQGSVSGGGVLEWQDEYGNWNTFDRSALGTIDAQRQLGASSITITASNGHTYVLDLIAMTQTNVQHQTVKGLRWSAAASAASALQRRLPSRSSLSRTALSHTAMWAPFAPAIAGITTPNAFFSCPNWGETAALYKYAHDHFCLTCPSSGWTVIRIELCVNTVKWESYSFKKRIMSKGLHGGENEQLVFHGTDEATIDKICKTGFNRSFSSQAKYGHGTYFARDAKYSSDQRYATPNSSGEQQMLLCRILAGEPCVGSQGMIQPSAKPSGILHESMVDNIGNPSIYVLSAGSDDCAYPEFRITFRK
tara:strand:+ start:95 stop:1123 length:1029 start_codon:yes stop_codon:yes gene_type:complete